MAGGIIWTHSLSIIRNINLSAFNLVRVTAWNLFRSDKVKTHFILRSVPIRINCTINSNSRQCCYEEQKKCRKSLSGWTFSWPIDGRSNGECSQLCRSAGQARAPLATVLMCSVWGLTFEDLKISALCRAPHLHDLLSIPRLYPQFWHKLIRPN